MEMSVPYVCLFPCWGAAVPRCGEGGRLRCRAVHKFLSPPRHHAGHAAPPRPAFGQRARTGLGENVGAQGRVVQWVP